MVTSKIIFLVLVIVAVAIETGADVLFKLSSNNGKSLLLWLGVGLYTIGTIIWAVSLRHELLSKAIVVFAILNIIAVILVGVLFFKEDLSLFAKIGIGLGVISLVLLQF